MSESDPQKRLLQLTQAIEQNIENKKREPSSIVVRVLFSRLTHYEDRKEIVPRMMCITGVQEEKTSYSTKVVSFESSFPLFNELRRIEETGQCLHLPGFVRQSEERILLQQSSAFVKVDNPGDRFPEILATNLHGLKGSAQLRLSEALFLEKLTVGENQRISFRCASCNLEWPAQLTQCKLCGEKERTAQSSVASIFTNHGDSRARVWLNATLSRALFRLSLEDLLAKKNVSKGLGFLEDQAKHLATLTFRLIFSHREGDFDRGKLDPYG